MDTSFPSIMMAYSEPFRQYFPAQYLAPIRDDVWALALLGTTSTPRTIFSRTQQAALVTNPGARVGVFAA